MAVMESSKSDPAKHGFFIKKGPGNCNAPLELLRIFAPWALYMIVLLVISLPAASMPAQKVHHYAEQTGERYHEFRLTFVSDGQTVITAEESDRTFITRCNASGDTLAWQIKGDGTTRRAEKSDGRLKVWKNGASEATVLSQDLGDFPWYQTLSFSLRFFLRAQKKEIQFWMLHPEKMTLMKMKAEKLETETATVQGSPVKCHRVRIRPAGPFSFFWKADYWFRDRDQLFVRYKSVHGPPGTPETEVWLLK